MDLVATSLTLVTAAGRHELVPGVDLTPVPGFAGEAAGALVFAGFGVQADGYDDLAGIDARDAIVVVLSGEPDHPRLFEGPEVVTAAASVSPSWSCSSAPVRPARSWCDRTGTSSASDRASTGGAGSARARSGPTRAPSPPSPWGRLRPRRHFPVLEVDGRHASVLLGRDVRELRRALDQADEPGAQGLNRATRQIAGDEGLVQVFVPEAVVRRIEFGEVGRLTAQRITLRNAMSAGAVGMDQPQHSRMLVRNMQQHRVVRPIRPRRQHRVDIALPRRRNRERFPSRRLGLHVRPVEHTFAPGAAHRFVDLDGEGLPGLLAETEGGWWYAPNAGGGMFEAPRPVRERPSSTPDTRPPRLLDLAGDGHRDLVELGDEAPGFFERTRDGWATFRPFERLPRIDWDDDDLRFVDLTGDGLADVLLTHDRVYRWYRSEGEAGYTTGGEVPRGVDELDGPTAVFSEANQTVFLADLCGDGLSDIVRIENGRVTYWPNLGYGHFGAMVTMERAPRFDTAERFDPSRIRLADVDGSGPVDLLYVADDGVDAYTNQSGRAWSDRRRIVPFPPAVDPATVELTDLLGTGTPCLVWSSPLPADHAKPLVFVDLADGIKSNVLVSIENGAGVETRLGYTSSTKFYLDDRRAGRPWITRVPFPVHVVERVDVFDHVARNLFTTRRTYHHGFFDGDEREFRGFGLVEQWDTEQLSALADRAT